MTAVTFKDQNGAFLGLVDYGGKLRPPHFSKEWIQSAPELPLAEDDVICCSYPKTGTHWIWEITQMVIHGSTTALIHADKNSFMFEHVTLDQARSLPGPRAWNCHQRFSDLPRDAHRLNNKIIFLYRHPKDVAVSVFHLLSDSDKYYRYKGDFNDFLDLFNAGQMPWNSYWDYLKDWDHVIKASSPHRQFHVVSYENLHKDTMGEIRRLCGFLGKDYSQDFLQRVEEACQLSNMRMRKGQEWELPDGRNLHYRKGKVGGWRKYFSEARNEEMDALIQKNLSHCQFDVQECD